MTQSSEEQSIGSSERQRAEGNPATDTLNLNPLPTDIKEIVERLRDGADRFLKWTYKQPYSGSPVISIPRQPGNIDALLEEAASALLSLAGERDEARRERAHYSEAYREARDDAIARERRAKSAEKQLAEAVGVLADIDARLKLAKPYTWGGDMMANFNVGLQKSIASLVAQHQSPQSSKGARSGVYVASRASIPERGEMWRRLRSQGIPINSTWIDEDGPKASRDLAGLWERIRREVTSAEFMVLYVEPDDFPLKGALIEAGMALAAQVPIRIVAPGVELEPRNCRPLGSWVKSPLISFHETLSAALALSSNLELTAEKEGESDE